MAPPAIDLALRRIPALQTLALAFLFSLVLPAIAGATADLACTPTHLAFGKVVVGQQKRLSATVSNTGSSAIKLSSLSVENHAFAVSGLSFPLTLKAHASVEFSVVFTPSSSSSEPAELLFKTSSGVSWAVSAWGRGVNNWSLSASPSSVAFGNVALGSSAKSAVILTNQGASTVIISQQSSPAGQFAVSGPTLPASLEAGESATFQVTFTPKWRGELASQFSVTSANEPVFAVPLSGSGGGSPSAQLTVTPSSLSFGSVTVGDTGTQAGTITARGGSVTISAASLGSSLFSLNGITLPQTLTTGQSASFDVVFTPQTGGTATSTLSFMSTAGDSPSAAALSGKGVEPVYTVSLSWNASTSEVAGYNVYRSSSSSGNFSMLNSTPDSATAFADNTVASGATYYYEVKSVTSGGVESSPCTPVKVTVN